MLAYWFQHIVKLIYTLTTIISSSVYRRLSAESIKKAKVTLPSPACLDACVMSYCM